MSKPDPIACGEKTAAAMLDMPVAKFLELVKNGALPPPCLIGDVRRWSVSDLRNIVNGGAARPINQDIEL